MAEPTVTDPELEGPAEYCDECGAEIYNVLSHEDHCLRHRNVAREAETRAQARCMRPPHG